MITVIDYGAGNLASLEGALDRLGLAFTRAERPAEAAPSGTLILPGVGHFGAAAAKLAERGWWSALRSEAAKGRPVLGVCLGLQLLAEGSDEAPGVAGLGLLGGHVRKLGPGVKVPHMGWSPTSPRASHPAIPATGGWLYFVHSYALEPSSDTIATADHGRAFSAISGKGRVLGFQPHPEKSGPFGLELLRGALTWMEQQCS